MAATVGVALVAALAPAASAGWHEGLGDGAGTGQGLGVGPEVPAIAWVALVEGLHQSGRHEGHGGAHGYHTTVLTERHAIINGAEGPPGDQTDRTTAVDLATGEIAWQVEGLTPSCQPAVGPDGTLWSIRPRAAFEPSDLVAVDTETGDVEVVLTIAQEWEHDNSRPCDSLFRHSIRLSPNGETLYLLQRQFVPGSADNYLLAIDVSTRPGSIRWVLELDNAPGQEHGGWFPEMRVAPAGSPNEGTLYLFQWVGELQGSIVVGTHSVVHAIDPDAVDTGVLPWISVHSAVDRSVEVPGNNVRVGAIVLQGDHLVLSTGESNPASDPDFGTDVTGWVARVHDTGTDLDVVTVVSANEGATRDDLYRPFTRLAVGTDDLLWGNTGAPHAQVVAMDPVTLDRIHALDRGCLVASSLVTDAAGYAYVRDHCLQDSIESVGPDGRVRWQLPLNRGVPVVGGGEVDLSQYGSFQIVAVDDDGKVIVQAATRTGAETPGLVLFALDAGTHTERRAGTNRIETAADIAQAVFPAGSDIVVVARAGDYPDALAGAPLAVSEGGPLLLSATDSLSAATEAEIVRLRASHAILLGGEAALSQAVADQLAQRGLTVERIAGSNRYDTARLVKERIGATQVVLVEGANPDPARGWPDAVAASGWAASTDRAILLATRDVLPDPTRGALAGVTDTIIVGGPGAVSDAVRAAVAATGTSVERLFGTSRYDTSVQVAERSLTDGNTLDVVWLATGTGFADALAAGPAAALTSGVLLLVHGTNPAGSPAVYDFLQANADDVGVVRLVGGAGAISDEVAAAVTAVLGR